MTFDEFLTALETRFPYVGRVPEAYLQKIDELRGNPTLAYDVTLDWKQFSRAIKVFSRRVHKNFYMEADEVQRDVFRVKVYQTWA